MATFIKIVDDKGNIHIVNTDKIINIKQTYEGGTSIIIEGVVGIPTNQTADDIYELIRNA